MNIEASDYFLPAKINLYFTPWRSGTCFKAFTGMPIVGRVVFQKLSWNSYREV